MSSASLEILRDGLVLPLTFIESASMTNVGRFDGSVHYADGSLCELGQISLPRHTFEPGKIGAAQTAFAFGSYVFGGILHSEHFGHFVTESLARLWVHAHLSQTDRAYVFYKRNESAPVGRFVHEFLDLLLPHSSVQILSGATRFESLVVPEELKQGSYMYGHPEIQFMFRRLKKLANPIGAKKVYVSRSRLTSGQGGILCENLIDEYMAAEGYAVIYPEKMTITQQIDIYTGAEKLVFADGSALHFYALFASPAQEVFVIWRREKYGIFEWQIGTFGGPRVQGEPCLERLWVPEDEVPDAVHGRALIRFSTLAEQLNRAGFITRSKWDDLSPSDYEGELEHVIKTERRPFIEMPLSTGSIVAISAMLFFMAVLRVSVL